MVMLFVRTPKLLFSQVGHVISVSSVILNFLNHFPVSVLLRTKMPISQAVFLTKICANVENCKVWVFLKRERILILFILQNISVGRIYIPCLQRLLNCLHFVGSNKCQQYKHLFHLTLSKIHLSFYDYIGCCRTRYFYHNNLIVGGEISKESVVNIN